MSVFRFSPLKFGREAYCALLQAWSRFDESLRYDPNLEWLLILTMPNSGSTALGKLLMTAKAAVALTEGCEGHWLVPSMSYSRNRWDENYIPSMERVRARWMWKLWQTANGSPRLVIEKSPPNMLRIDELRAALSPMKSHTVILVRDPYAVCESWHRRYGKKRLAKSPIPELAQVDDEMEYFKILGEYWARRWTCLAKQERDALCVVRYEDLVADPDNVVARLASKIPLLSDVATEALVAVKDYEPQTLRNMNDQQIAALSKDQIAAISSGLKGATNAIISLGYTLR